MAEHPIICGPSMVASVLNGKRSQLCLVNHARFSGYQPGTRLWLQESFAPGRVHGDDARDYFTALRHAEFLVMVDGWRQHRTGSGHRGARVQPQGPHWMPAIHMPRWGSRATLTIDAVREMRLHDLTRQDFLAEGEVAAFAGLCVRWRQPYRGIWRDPATLFKALWNAANGSAGERWEDNPAILAITVQRVA